MQPEGVLCTSCGLCCDGTLYGLVPLDADESEPMRRRGLRVIMDGDSSQLEQPCAALRGCLCAIYSERPRACARYECELLKSVKAGTRDAGEARATLDRTKALLAAVRAGLGLAPDANIWQAIVALQKPETPEAERAWAQAHGQVLRDLGDLLKLLREVFEPKLAMGGGAAR